MICKFFMATLFQTCLLTDDTINQQFYKLIIIILVGKEKGRLFEKRVEGGGQSFKFFHVTQGFYEALPGDTKNSSVRDKAVQGSKRKPKVYHLYISQKTKKTP